MEKGNIKIVEIADFKNSEHVLDYVDNDFVIINSLEGSPYNEDTIRLGCFLIAICLEGCIQLDVNYKTYQLEAADFLDQGKEFAGCGSEIELFRFEVALWHDHKIHGRRQ